jgi:diaminohydroxyphosphoribosylaminopyrimidine deaminase/5-amino-6-(5-phosphoribosylamino)uracil reductase
MKRREDYDLLQKMEAQNKIVFIGGDTRVACVHAIQEELHRRGIMTVLLEGGSAISGSFFDAGEIDQYLYFIAPKIIGHGTPAIDGDGISAMQDSVRLKDVSTAMIQEDLLYSGYRDQYNFEMM